jgi:phospho-N-acetylmuramoyl-pentapeptide-transferase
MLYELLVPLADVFSPLNVFRYITFRASYAMMTALLISFWVGPRLIRWLERLNVGQTIRAEGPESHQSKAGTPTMGGLLIVLASVGPTLLWADLSSHYVQLAVLTCVGLGLLGFVDDYLLVVRKMSKGLLGRYKLLGQALIGASVGIAILATGAHGDFTEYTTVPFLKDYRLYLGELGRRTGRPRGRVGRAAGVGVRRGRIRVRARDVRGVLERSVFPGYG